ncbi:hypothetical protein Mapa_001951 [Marchantia paleacea]|nr:hypothetical protein Mapa_001951 [Marchantia paleacea]
MGEISCGRIELPEGEQDDNPLFQPLQMGPVLLFHRIVLAPLTRSRSYGGFAQPHAALYYGQRTTSGGLLITEATGISLTADGVPNTPSCYTDEHVAAWKPVVKAVHDKGGIFFVQLWHVGRQSHTAYQPNGAPPASPTSKRLETGMITLPDGKTLAPFSQPRKIETHDISSLVQDFVTSAKQAMAAGFDGVEIHAANGYLLDQFMKDSINDRTDLYGGSIENRCRFPLEVVDAVIDAIGADRVGFRLSPHADYGDSRDSQPMALATYMAEQLSKRSVVYAHYLEPRMKGAGEHESSAESLWPFRKKFKGVLIATGGYSRKEGMKAVKNGKADCIGYGRHFLANPDLPKRFRLNAALNKANPETYSIPDPVVGYTDYPFLEEEL